MDRLTTALSIFAGLLMLTAGSAHAAPQVLGIVASNGKLPLLCDAQGCRGDLSTFCLQQPRQNPEPGQQYTLADSRSLTLVGSNAKGEAIRLPAAPYMSFVSDRGFTSVAVSIPPELVAKLGLTTVAVEVARDAALVPVAASTDANPQSADELALALGAHRQQGEKFFDDRGQNGDAIRLTNVMINALPTHQRQPSDTDGHVLDAALRADAAQVADPTGVALARGYYDACRVKTDVTHHVDSLRSCLQGTHDRLVINTNVDFWRSLNSY
jgi:hypothetical protein